MRALLLGLLCGPSVAFAATGSIEVKVSNAPGEVVLDGFPTGQNAPTLLEDVPVGSHQLELEYGCMVGSMSVDVVEGQKAVVNLPLQNRGGTGHLRLKNLPDNADVVVDGAPVANAESGVELKCGNRRVQVDVPGYTTWETMVVITSGKWVNTPVKLTQEDFAPEPTKPPPRPPVEEEEEDEEPEEPEEPKTPSRYSDLDDLDSDEEEPPRRSTRVEEEEEEDPEPEVKKPKSNVVEEEEEDEPEDDFEDEPEDDDYEDEPEDDDYEDEPEDDRYEDEDDYDRDPDEDEDEDLDEIGTRGYGKDPRDAGPGFPTRGVVTGVTSAVGVTGLIIGFAVTPDFLDKKGNYEQLVAVGSSKADPYKRDELDPVRQDLVQAFGLGAVGVAAAGLSWVLIPGRDASDLVITPTLNGFNATIRF